MKRIIGANALVLIISVVSTALGGTFLFTALLDSDVNNGHIYNAIHDAFVARDEISKVNKRVTRINSAISNELRRGKVINKTAESEFVVQKVEDEVAEKEINNPEPNKKSESLSVSNNVKFVKNRLKRFNNKNVKPLSASIEDIKTAKTKYEKKKMTLDLLDKRFIFAWDAKYLKNHLYSKVSDLTSTSSGTQFVTIKKVTKEKDGTKTFDLQVWTSDDEGVRRESREFSVSNEWPFAQDAVAEVAVPTDSFSGSRSFLASDREIAKDIAEDSVLVQELYTLTPELSAGEASEDIGRHEVIQYTSEIGGIEADLKDNCIKPSVDGCTVYEEVDERIDPLDPFNELLFEDTSSSAT